ncbi:MAG: VWA domain-containing protein [Chloroflexota bacterium]|nr:VWA domain-containing protein [Chloroflexota bacterium]
MTLLNPAGAWWLLLLPILLLLYLLRTRPVVRRVASLRLWHNLPQVERPRTQLRRPPRSPLLALQLLLLAAGAIALIRPALPGLSARHLLILLDASGSMSALDGGTPRFEQARTQAGRLVAALGADDRATLLRVGATVTTACSVCRQGDLDVALAGLHPGVGHADWAAALALAGELAGGAGDRRGEAVVISDGAFAPPALASFPVALRFVAVGGPLANRGIAVLQARRPPDGRPAYTAYAGIVNHSPVTSTVEVTALADTVPLPSHQLLIPAGGEAAVTWDLPVGTAQMSVHLTPPDALAADNSALILLPVEGQHRVRLQTATPDLYRRVLAGVPGLAITTTTGITGDVTLLDGLLPDPLPPGGLLLINPGGALLPSDGTLENVRAQTPATAHPLLAGLDVAALLVQKARRITPPPWLEPLISADGGPLLLAGVLNGRRVAVLTFDPQDSNLPQLATFPVLLTNLLDWLDPLVEAGAQRPGAAIPLPAGTLVGTPDGRNVTVGAAGLFADTEAAGLYRVTRPGRPDLAFAVNATDAAEADLMPRPQPELTQPAPAAAGGHQEVWRPLAGLALAFMCSEWFLYCRRRGRL